MAITSRRLTARTRRLDPADPRHDRPLLELLPGGESLSWVREGEGLVGRGCAARLDTSGTARFTDADAWWRQLCGHIDVDDEVGLPGCGPVAFTSLAFADQPGDSVLVLPEVVVGEHDGVRWITTIGDAPEPAIEPVRQPGTVSYSDGRLSSTGYRQAVTAAVDRMRDSGGDLLKVVLAHDLVANTSEPLDERFLLHNLAARYSSCWTFAVDGLVGATPELLLERRGYEVRSRVLAGTAWPHPGRTDDEIAAELLASAKNRSEHQYASESLAERLRPFCSELSVPDSPSVLRLRNVLHLATDVEGKLADTPDGPGLLNVVEAVHPTAAVGGTPTADAVQLIAELEGMDRGRYAGPVGWIDGAGNGEFGIALRCGQIEQQSTAGAGSGGARGGRVRLFAGGGIVPDSDPDQEVAEAEAKLLPVREALEGVR
ncbi:isochorismate synthase [Saccharopolyspora tripterygii]